MICKKCGAANASTSKFCGYCGEVQIGETNNIDNKNIEAKDIDPLFNPDLNETMKIEPIEFSTSFELGDETDLINKLETKVKAQINNEIKEQKEENNNAQVFEIEALKDEENNVQPVENNETVVDTKVSVNEFVETNNSAKGNKKNVFAFVLIGFILVVVAVLLLVYAFKNSSSGPISTLEKAIGNLTSNEINSATIGVNMDLEADGEALSVGGNIKLESKNDNESNIQITLNDTKFFDEINAYVKVDKENATLYLESTTIDMLGITSSVTPIWINYAVESSKMLNEIDIKETEESKTDLNLDEFIDSKHFVKLESKNGLNRYQLIIDQELVDSLVKKAERYDDSELKEAAKELEESFKGLKSPLKIDFYITDSNEFSKIELDMSNQLSEEDGISKIVLSIELEDLNNTKVEIPNDVLDSTMSLETYMSTYSNLTDSNGDVSF